MAPAYLLPLALEFGLLLYFLYILRTRGTQKDRKSLFIISIILSFFASVTILEVLNYSMIPPLPPPPATPENWYSDAMVMRSLASMKAQVEAIFLFILALSYMCAKSQE